jgi:tocopherol cyclase
MRRLIQTTLTPAMYHGHRARPPFFEGWYFKLISPDERHRYAIIPGVILGEQEHAFIQVLNGLNGTAAYHTLPLETFWASDAEFDVRIGDSHFRVDGISLDTKTQAGSLHGHLTFDDPKPWPVSWRSPGIMGWYAWIPGMECYHGVLSFDHAIHGKLTIDGQEIDFEGGRGYIEKDWGKSFPSAWVWFQSNHFERPGTCITASVAVIPFGGTTFNGFIVGLWHAGRLYRFATYTGAMIEVLDIADDHVRWVVSDREHLLELVARKAQGGLILGPTRRDMGIHVNETLQATVEVRLISKEGADIFSGQGRHAGLEVQGELDRLRLSAEGLR